MVFHVNCNPLEIKNLVDTGGLVKGTIQKQQKVGAEFDNYLKAKNAVFSEIVETPSILEPYLLSYLQDMRLSRSVDGKVVLEMPKRNTVLDIKSSLKNYILQVTQNRIDISSGGQFPQFFQLLKGLFEVVGY